MKTAWVRIDPFIPYLYLIAGVFVAFKLAILGVQMHFESKIEEKTKHLQKIIEEQRDIVLAPGCPTAYFDCFCLVKQRLFIKYRRISEKLKE